MEQFLIFPFCFQIPQASELVYGIDSITQKRHKYPLVKLQNVYMFPGVPSMLMHAFDMLEDLFCDPATKSYVRDVYIGQDEMSIASILNETEEHFRDSVTIGSYPDFYNRYVNTTICGV